MEMKFERYSLASLTFINYHLLLNLNLANFLKSLLPDFKWSSFYSLNQLQNLHLYFPISVPSIDAFIATLLLDLPDWDLHLE